MGWNPKKHSEYLKKIRIAKTLKGECRQCKNSARPNKILCTVCQHRNKIRFKARSKECINKGLCIRCTTRKSIQEKHICEYCVKNHAKNKSKHFFKYKATHFNGQRGTNFTAWDLWKIWKKQRGRSALTGKKLAKDDSPELDHIVPKSRGGTDTLSNLQWLTKIENRAKHDLSINEFIEICRAVSNHFKEA
jgi:HNH endonuclease